jgi:hypothetical protein
MNLVWLILSVGFNIVVFTVVLVYLVFGRDPTYFGPIGDSIGGFFGPIIGGASLYFIYQTLREQRAALFFLDISKKLDDLAADFGKLNYSGSNPGINGEGLIGLVAFEFLGMESLRRYLAQRSLILFEQLTPWQESDDRFLSQLVQICEKFSNLYARVATVEQLIAGLHKDDLDRNFREIISIYVVNIVNIFYNINFVLSLKIGPSDGEEFDQIVGRLDAQQIAAYNRAISFLARYQDAMEIFVRNGFLGREQENEENNEFRFQFFEEFDHQIYRTVGQRGQLVIEN